MTKRDLLARAPPVDADLEAVVLHVDAGRERAHHLRHLAQPVRAGTRSTLAQRMHLQPRPRLGPRQRQARVDPRLHGRRLARHQRRSRLWLKDVPQAVRAND